MKLPPWDIREPTPLPERNVLSVKINAENKLMVEGEALRLSDLRERAKEFITNPLKLKSLPSSPQKAIISLQNDRSTHYEAYVEVYDQLRAAYNELWNEKAEQLFGKSYEDLSDAQKKEIKNLIPLVISEAEPTDLAMN